VELSANIKGEEEKTGRVVVQGVMDRVELSANIKGEEEKTGRVVVQGGRI
jgi:hypothetical protein